MSATQDFVALEWIRGELANTLQNAQVALEAVAESPDDAASMRSCLTAIHQVHGTLKMVQLKGPTEVAGEMEQVAQALMNSKVPDVSAAQETLMQAILQLPAYLDRIHRDQKDSEQNYLPMVNNLRVSRGEEKVPGTESPDAEGGGPDLGPLITPPTDAVVNAYFQAVGEGNLPKIRARYKIAFANILKKNDVRENLTTIGKLFSMLVRLCGESPVGNMSQLGLAVVEGIASGGIKLDNTSAGLLRSVDPVLEKLASAGQDGLAEPVPESLATGLIDLINGASKESDRIRQLRQRYAAVAAEPEAIAIGPDEETMSAVAKILIEELTSVTDKLDLYVRSQNRNSADLLDLRPNLEQISSTMVVLGDKKQQQVIASQIEVINGIEANGDPGEDVLLEMAQSLLQIESSLAGLVIDAEDDGDSFASLDEAQAAVVRETRSGLAAAKDAVIDFISSDFDHTKLVSLPDDLMALRGGLTIVNQQQAGDVLVASANYIRTGLLQDNTRPELEQMDDLADALTSVDYYLERLLENAGDPYLQMLEVAEAAVEKLGYAVGAPAPAAVEEPSAEVVEEPSAELVEQPSAELVEEPSAEVLEEPVEAEEEDSLIDDEILEIFVDEAEEVLETIGEFLPQWQNNTSDEEALTEVRRAFHTLKGSGRMVGATVVGELAWSIENLLNRVIDNTVTASPAVLDIISTVVSRIPEGIAAFKAGKQEEFDPTDMAAVADALAEGREPPASAAAPAVEEEPSAALVEEPSAEVIEEPSAALVEEPSSEIVEEPSADLEESFDLDEVEDDTFSLDEIDEDTAEISIAADDSFDLDEVDVSDASEEAASEETDFLLEEESAPSVETEQVLSLDDAGLDDDFSLETGDFDLDTPSIPTVSSDTEVSLVESDDLSLEEIFAMEAEEKLEEIDAFVSTGGLVSSAVVAAFHTLKGSAAMAEIPVIADIAGPLEKLANDYLLQQREADAHFLQLARDGSMMIRLALTDLDMYRQHVDGAPELVARIGSDQASASADISFDFAKIMLLSEANIAADGWQDVDALIAELEHTLEQAEALNQPDLAALVKSMRRVYVEASGRPDDLVLSLMRRAHDHLVFMFDALASSQHVRPADRVVAELDALAPASFGEPSADKEPSAEPVEEPSAVAVEEPSAEPVEDSALPVAAAIELPADEIDEDILPIFLEESEELLEEVDESIQGWIEQGEPGEHLDNLLRQLHTIKGGSRMAGLLSLGEFTHNFETFLIGVQSHPVNWDDRFFGLLNAQQDEITRRVEIYQKLAAGAASEAELQSMRTGTMPSLDAPAAQVVADAAPEAAPVAVATVVADAVVDLPDDAVDEDILPIFLEESDDLVEELESSIQSWSESPGDMEILDVLLRNLHTLKGGARMAGLNSLGEYAHNFETFLIGIQQNPIELDDDFFSLLNKRQDEVIRRVEIYKKLSVGAATDDELASLKQAIEPTLETEPVTADGSEPAQQAVKAPAADAGDKAAASAAQEMVRVSADLLEELISLAGESSITRGRVEQQISDFGESLDEMEETINRIRDQVRRLEIEAESRETLIRTRQVAEHDSSFDDLEMDRYTMLQTISRALNEATSDMMDLKETLANRSRDAETILHQQARISGELQEGLTRTSLVPFARLIPRLRRIVRQVSAEIGKSVRFDAYNVEGELDRNVLERIVAPLEHMLRNAVDHGIESKEDRAAVGKPEQGRISLRLSREGGYFVLTVSDDGGGINVDAVRKKAIERGLMTASQKLSDHDVMQFILHAGFSTAQKLTQISGRGVGMDVVVSEIRSLGGSITIDSTLGVGSEFTIRIPFTVSINRALMVVVREETYAVPLNTIEGIVRVSPYELEAYYQPDAPMFEYAGQPYRLAYMGKLLDQSSEDPDLSGQVAPLPVILARSGDESVALQVDRVIGSREVVVKSLGAQFDDVGGISGATVLGDGRVVIILDCMALVRSVNELPVQIEEEVQEAEAEAESSVRTVMIVDDSVTVRKVTSRLMERNGYEVATAKDGVDAMGQLQDIRPDVVLLDIEMPRMDGFEVLRSVRRDENLKDLPIIMITSRTGEKHKQQAMELGVNEYLGKPFQEASLLSTIEEVISRAKAKPES